MTTEESHIGDLALRIQQSDSRAFHLLFDFLWRDMYVFACSILKDNATAEDIVQEVWADYWIRRKQIIPQNIKPYLIKAVRNKVYKHLRDQRLDSQHLDVLERIEILPEIEEQLIKEDTTKEVFKIINCLPDRCREIFILSRFEGLDNEEIAQQLDISKRSVENQLSIALKRLRNELHPSPSLLSSVLLLHILAVKELLSQYVWF